MVMRRAVFKNDFSKSKSNKNHTCRSSSRIPGHWPPSPQRCQPSTKALPHAHICTQHCCRKVSFLVLHCQAPQDQEGQRRDRLPQCGMCQLGIIANSKPFQASADSGFIDLREETSKGQELWHLDPIRLSFRYPQHVQGVPRDVKDRGCRLSLPRHGCPPPLSLPVNPRM